MDDMTFDFILRILVAALLGGAVGLEREYREKAAGFRTHFLVALGSALFMIISAHGFSDALVSSEHRLDVSRIAAQVVSGIGFIGAGTIIFQKNAVRGLTTAASIWVTAAVGLACGAGMYVLAAVATLLVLLGLEAFNYFLRLFDRHRGADSRGPRELVLLVMTLLSATLWAQGPNGTGKYYRPANGKAGAELKTAMYSIIKNPNVVTYGNGLKMGYIKTDTRPDGYLRDFYSNITNYVPGSDMAAGQYEGFNYNREHTVCQSWFGSVSPMYSDIVMVIPTDGYINSRRNDNPFGEVTDQEAQVKTSENGYSKWGAPRKGLLYPDSIAQKVTTVFEPNDEVKGDIARIYFYMATCYEDRATTFCKGSGKNVFNAEGTAYEPLHPWVMEMMMRWAALDPVDSIETARNDSVFVVQGNRNPYVDYPGLEDYVWGDKRDEPFVYGDGSDDDDDDEGEPSTSGTILLNNEFFGVDWTGQRPSGGVTQMKGQKGGITVTYAKGASGQSMFCNSQQIRLYKYNELTFSISDGEFQAMDFNVVKNDNNKEFFATNGTVEGYHWTGNSNEVQFTVTEGNGNIQLSSVDITLVAHQPTLVPYVATESQQTGLYDLQGRRLHDGSYLRPGIYIRNGRKVIIR